MLLANFYCFVCDRNLLAGKFLGAVLSVLKNTIRSIAQPLYKILRGMYNVYRAAEIFL